MNLSARIKSAKNKPNYILNVNINIPIRPSNLQSYRPVSGEFTFSPNHHNKKLKLQIPSARTTNQCESRKISYLGETQNTISYRQNNRKKGSKSAFPADQISQLINGTKKSKSQFRSQAVSPSGKRSVSKKSKILSSHQITKSRELVKELITQSQDNIMRYTNQSSELESMGQRWVEQPQTEEKDKVNIKKLKLKSQSPILQQEKVLIYGIRQFQKTAQFKKQHLNYQYLKSKLLVLASVKKIQRAWRSYKTKKLIKSYSNNISLKFTGKMKNQLLSKQETEEPKILTVRSCGYNSQASELKRQGKKNLSLLYPREEKIQEQFLNEDSNLNQTIILTSNKKQKQKIKNDKAGEKNVKSAIAKFQMEEIKKWEQLIKNIKQGKKVEDVLEKSFRRKEELEKQLSNNLKEMISSKSSDMSNKSREEQKDVKKYQKPQAEQIISNDIVNSQVSLSSSNQTHEKFQQKQEHILKMEEKQKPFDTDRSEYDEEEEGATTQRRRQKLQYFQNELRKIDNQYSESNLSHSEYSESSAFNTPEEVRIKNPFFKKDAQEEQNVKLKRKIEAINRVQMFNCQQDSEDSNAQKQKDHENNNYLYTSLVPKNQAPFKKEKIKNNKRVTIKQIEETYQERDGEFFPLTIEKKTTPNNETIEFIEDDRLETFRNRNVVGATRLIYEDLQTLRLKQLKKRKLSQTQKSGLVAKIEEQILFDLLLEFSEKEGFITKMEALYIKNNHKPEIDNEKPEGICTNLESIKDYLENLVAFAFEQESQILVEGFNEPKGPSAQILLKNLRKSEQSRRENLYTPVLSENLFDRHWMYASEQIYFDARYPTDPSKQQERVKYLKLITKMYFKAIFNSFNECLEQFRVYGIESKPFPWQFNLRKKSTILNLVDIKPLIRGGYRKLSQMAVVYCGLLFEDKKHNMSLKMVEELQKQRLDTLVEMQIEQDQHNWNSTRIEKAQVLFKIGYSIWQSLVKEVCDELKRLR